MEPIPKPFQQQGNLQMAPSSPPLTPLPTSNSSINNASSVYNNNNDHSSNGGLRLDMIAQAVAFLASSATSSAPLSARLDFLRGKGLSDAELDYAIDHTGILTTNDSNKSDLVREWQELMHDMPKWLFWSGIFMGGLGLSTCWHQWPQVIASFQTAYGKVSKFVSQEILSFNNDSEEEEVEVLLAKEVAKLREELSLVRGQMAYVQARQQLMMDMKDSPLLTPSSSYLYREDDDENELDEIQEKEQSSKPEGIDDDVDLLSCPHYANLIDE